MTETQHSRTWVLPSIIGGAVVAAAIIYAAQQMPESHQLTGHITGEVILTLDQTNSAGFFQRYNMRLPDGSETWVETASREQALEIKTHACLKVFEASSGTLSYELGQPADCATN